MGDIDDRIEKLRSAFDDDQFEIAEEGVFIHEDRIGLIAEHKTAINYDTGQRKRAYYVEGSPSQMGYLLGWMAEPEIHRMTSEFIDRVLWSMIKSATHPGAEDAKTASGLRLIDVHSVLIELIYKLIQAGHVQASVPRQYKDEIKAMAAGCAHVAKMKQRAPSVTEEELWVLNAGLDCLLAIVYTGKLLPKRLPKLKPEDLRLPFFCNAFALLDEVTDQDCGVLFGRDFMFATGDVFQDVACLTIYNPQPVLGGQALPLVSANAPGFVGSIAAMNINGVAAGVDMSPGANCDVRRPGMNSLLVVRDCIEHGTDADGAVNRVIAAERGVAYNYPIADGGDGRNRACVVEAGAVPRDNGIPFYDYIKNLKPELLNLLPDEDTIKNHRSGEDHRGAMVRWERLTVPEVYLDLNPPLFTRFQKKYRQEDFGEDGYIDKSREDTNCPEMYYFAPVRGVPDRVVLVTNHYLHPEMRLCGMNHWTNRLAGGHIDDVQWRYDELNHRIHAALENTSSGKIGYDCAKDLIDFLSPCKQGTPEYYECNPTSRDGKKKVICGCVSLFDLKNRTVESHFGYYGDKWVKITLKRYVA